VLSSRPSISRVQKSKKKSVVTELKDREREALIEYVESRSLASDMPLQKLNKQQKEWDEKEEKAGEELLALHQEFARLQTQMAEAASRLSRIRTTRKLVRERQAEAFERGMQEIDEEDGVLPALDAHEKWVVNDLQAAGVPSDP
ncbi:hypothetical protein CCHR01_20006, partial [Colletotrichum chrysophilum]